MLLTLPLTLRAVDSIRLYVFLATACPISNRYIPELNRIAATYQPKGVRIQACFPESDLTQQALDAWAREYKPAFAFKLDPHAVQAHELRATLTPEAVIVQGGRLVYRGRIDDRYVSWGKSRPQPARRDVVKVLDELLAGRSPAARFTKAWGCVIE
ncbi:MAG: hypothetical protein FJW36_09030 [Acidobacteria bacterium]|nr:hypothetical protein [Acidobacteriota bacterium]